MPVILPHELVPYLIQHNIMLNNDDMDQEIEKYWQFLSYTGFPHSTNKAGTGCIPLWIWGDDAQYNELQSKVVIVAIGCVLDPRTCSKTTVWPLFAYKVEPWTFRFKKCSIFVKFPSSNPMTYLQILPLTKENSLGFPTLQSFLKPVPRQECTALIM